MYELDFNEDEDHACDETHAEQYYSCSQVIMLFGTPMLLLIIIFISSLYVSMYVIPVKYIECDHNTYNVDMFNCTNRYLHTQIKYEGEYLIYYHIYKHYILLRFNKVCRCKWAIFINQYQYYWC